ncbi:response regulator [Azospirillum rugosum]|uniref:CheY-like chemotaxis protein n=1 Tax=Azospirillum rugosum TaxID=416170 RepID=A0ABS4SHS8_9PROT|nr:response regulator [Azospirillum rugosum]MBP2292142.1 CheY-like chemotaxis protein [Azospirillum rugosum]MDQ0525722.1 CheY-like chemotaxis protein [Azospirillum rugosum]
MARRYPSHLKILVVENNALLQRALRDMLELWGVGQVVTVSNGQEAKELLRREPYDLLVTDWMMEPVGGAQLVSWVRRSPGSLSPDLPIIVLTANADLATVRAAWDAGADSVLAKPASAATIARRIETVLTRPRRPRPSRPEAEPEVRESRPEDRPEPAPSRPASSRPALSGGSPLRLPPPGPPVRSAEPRRVRLLLALDRLEAALDKPDPLGTRLRHAVSDLQIAASADPTGVQGASAMVASLSTCVTWVDHDAESFKEAVQAHMDALRWVATTAHDAETAVAVRALVRALRSMVRTLTLRGSADPSLWPDAPDGQSHPLPPAS